MASICSVTVIEPSSLAIPEALRPATISPVMTGPSCRTMPTETSCPINETEPNRSNYVLFLRLPRFGKKASEHNNGNRSPANEVSLLDDVSNVERATEEVANGLDA